MPSSTAAEPSPEAAFSRIARYYDEKVGEYGYDPRACDYGRPESQRTKFEVLARVTPLAGKRLLDVGCGFADFADFLGASTGEVTYVGVDLSPEMIARAKERHPELSLRVGNILAEDAGGVFDVVTANGIFYLLGADARATMQTLLRRMWELSSVATAFNSLSSWAVDQEPGEFHADPIETLGYCRSLTPYVTLRHDYHSRDFTIYMYRQPQYSGGESPRVRP